MGPFSIISYQQSHKRKLRAFSTTNNSREMTTKKTISIVSHWKNKYTYSSNSPHHSVATHSLGIVFCLLFFNAVWKYKRTSFNNVESTHSRSKIDKSGSLSFATFFYIFFPPLSLGAVSSLNFFKHNTSHDFLFNFPTLLFFSFKIKNFFFVFFFRIFLLKFSVDMFRCGSFEN